MTLKPGIYRATVCGKPDVDVIVGRDGDYARLITGDRLMITWGSADKDITDARPLILLDLDNRRTQDLVQAIREMSRSSYLTDFQGVILRELADDLAEQTKPPRIEEPGLWGVVEASSPLHSRRTEFVHRSESPISHHWACIGDGDVFAWDSLIDPTLIREGLS